MLLIFGPNSFWGKYTSMLSNTYLQVHIHWQQVHVIQFGCAWLHVKHQVRCSSSGTGIFHSTLVKSKESLQMNDSIISPKDFSVLRTRNCRTWRSDWWELFWCCSNEAHIICADKHDQLLYPRKKICNKSQLKAAENKLDDVILISQYEYDIKPVDYLSVHRVFDSLR